MLLDSDIDEFLASMPEKPCKEFERSILDLPFVIGIVFLAFPIMFAVPVGGWVGRMLGLPFSGCVAVGLVWFCGWSCISALLITRFTKWRLCQHLKDAMVDGLLPSCPVCRKTQSGNSSRFCDCGCLVRPFVGKQYDL